MSHFTVLVTGHNIAKQLEPFWELDLSREELENDPRAIFQDCTAEVAKEYAERTVEHIRTPDNRLLLPWDKEVSELDQQNLPDGFSLEDVPVRELHKTAAEYAEEWHHYSKITKEDGTTLYGYFHNPNAKWDWYQVGGRWAGYFRLKQVQVPEMDMDDFTALGFANGELKNLKKIAEENPEKFNEIVRKYDGQEDALRAAINQMQGVAFAEGKRGTNGLMGSNRHEGQGFADMVMKKNIDIEWHQENARKEAEEYFDKIEAVMTKQSGVTKTWDEILDANGRENMSKEKLDECRDEYGSQPAVIALKKADLDPLFGQSPIHIWRKGREAYVKEQIYSTLATYAVLHDGKWYQKGDMGWWGMSSNEVDNWEEQWWDLFNSLPDDTLITIVDCHI